MNLSDGYHECAVRLGGRLQPQFSADRWALTGEAGLFLDPFYSPGSDFIAIGNTYITELVARDRAGQPLAAHAQLYEQIFRSFYDSTLALYVDQYGLFGSPSVLPVKIVWDYTYYWSVLAQMFVQERLTDLATLAHLRDELALAQRLNVAVQALLRRWGAALTPAEEAAANLPVLHDQAALPWFAELNRALFDRDDEAAFRARLKAAVARLCALAAEVQARARVAGVEGEELAALLAARPAAATGGEPLLFRAPETAAAA